VSEDGPLLRMQPAYDMVEAMDREGGLGVQPQVAASADLLAVDTKVVERLSAPAENELQNVVKLFQRKVVRY
jgi:hypothetical protein